MTSGTIEPKKLKYYVETAVLSRKYNLFILIVLQLIYSVTAHEWTVLKGEKPERLAISLDIGVRCDVHFVTKKTSILCTL